MAGLLVLIEVFLLGEEVYSEEREASLPRKITLTNSETGISVMSTAECVLGGVHRVVYRGVHTRVYLPGGYWEGI